MYPLDATIAGRFSILHVLSATLEDFHLTKDGTIYSPFILLLRGGLIILGTMEPLDGVAFLELIRAYKSLRIKYETLKAITDGTVSTKPQIEEVRTVGISVSISFSIP